MVDTTNFTDKTAFQGSGTGLHVVERFTCTDPQTLRYEFTVDDAESFAPLVRRALDDEDRRPGL